ncbi:hypothetical protein ASD64_09465 [Mesorhizobium sp. Root157]|nr:hypothetical protein ASD64_09465 [Mesorhizobium sp. Root157]
MLKATVGAARLAGGAQGFMLAPMVVALRLPIMAAESQSEMGWGSETLRAISEKTAATMEGALAAQLSLIGSTLNFWPQVLAGRSPTALTQLALERAMGAALRPAGRRVKANFRRLSCRSI